MGRKATKKTSARELRQREAQRRQRQRLIRRASIAGGVIVVVLLVVLGVHLLNNSGTTAFCNGSDTTTCTPNSGKLSDPGLPNGETIDGVQCGATEEITYHVHAHLRIFINGKQQSIPAGIGIEAPRTFENSETGASDTASDPYAFVVDGGCYYWLHVHDYSGVIHMEAPTGTTFELGSFFDIWGEHLSSTRVGPYVGKLYVYVNGAPWTQDPRLIPLKAHTVIQIDYGTNVPFKPYTFPSGL